MDLNTNYSGDNQMNSSKKLSATQLETVSSAFQITSPHKLTIKTLVAFKEIINKVDNAQKSKWLSSNYHSLIQFVYRGRLVCRNSQCFQLTVSKEQAYRAIYILDNLAKKLEKKNFKN